MKAKKVVACSGAAKSDLHRFPLVVCHCGEECVPVNLGLFDEAKYECSAFHHTVLESDLEVVSFHEYVDEGVCPLCGEDLD